MKVDQIRTVAIIGGGLMGHGIAQLASVAGFNVLVRDISQDLVEKAKQNIEKNIRRSVERSRMTEEAARSALSRVRATVDLGEAVRGAELIIEAIPENLELKKKVWSDISSQAKEDSVLTTNTSSISITAMAEAVLNPERFAGMHFFNPPVVMRLVEVIPGAKTSAETLNTVKYLAEKMGKTPVIVLRDSPGFIVNRILITYLNEAAKLTERGKWTKEQMDSSMQYKAKMPLGPFMLADLIGLDIVYNILKVFEESLGPSYRPASSIEGLFKANKLGRKTGEGFYSYKEQPTVSEEAGKGFDLNLLIEPMIAEAEKVVKEGVANKESVDTAMKLGANLPQGPFEMAKNV